ncbi:hypothetical protein DL98DRAFT_607004 [Cadophora sp. DSE1049]|nr:hypothetical protein DL98DRAFT_607004 [Cadophora sp. DSE1049]
MFSGNTIHDTENVNVVRDYRSMPGTPGIGGFLNHFESAKMRHRGQGSEWPAGMARDDWDKGFRFWSGTVEEYSKKEFTFDTDILDACTGILHAFQGYSGWTILQGMPEPVFDLALLWVPSTTVERRPPLKVHRSELTTEFPSWSWLGWRGGATFPLTGKSPYRPTLASEITHFEKCSGSGDGFAEEQEQVNVQWNTVLHDQTPFDHSSIQPSHTQAQSAIIEQSSRFLKFRSVTVSASNFTFRRTPIIGQSYIRKHTNLPSIVHFQKFRREARF